MLLLVILFVTRCFRNYYKPGIRAIPGPFIAKFTNVWRLCDVWKGRADITHIKLHRKYGVYVRLGPNAVSISKLSDIKNIYGINKGYEKSKFYRVQQQLNNGRPVVTLFSSTNEDFHATIKRPISSAYSMTTLTEFEPFVDRTISLFIDRLKHEFVNGKSAGKACDISKWLQFYAFDVIGELKFSRRLGFIEQSRDVDNMIADLDKVMGYNGVRTNVFAGSDTTAISLRAILYYTLKSPRVHAKLLQELSTAASARGLSSPISWKESQELPYLDAVVKEALRLHPAVGLPLERIVPARGLKLSNGVFLPSSTIVGTSPWVLYRDTSIFGENVDGFIPERWLQAPNELEEVWKARRLQMIGATFTFGAGPRTCIGKNISLLEIYKLIPSMLLSLKIELANSDEVWKVRNSWFIGQGSIPVILQAML